METIYIVNIVNMHQRRSTANCEIIYGISDLNTDNLVTAHATNVTLKLQTDANDVNPELHSSCIIYLILKM